jgi:hypothetical protein
VRKDDRERPFETADFPKPSSRSYERREHHSRRSPESANRKQGVDEERQAKLALMQADASNLESDRSRRLAEMEQREAEEKERDERKRDRGVDFKSALYQQTEAIGLEGRLKNSRRTQLST